MQWGSVERLAMHSNNRESMLTKRRALRLMAAAIGCGLCSRLGPNAIVRVLGRVHAGDVCYAVAAFGAIHATAHAVRLQPTLRDSFLISTGICWFIELSQLLRTPEVDAFRAAGAHWLLGSRYGHADMLALLAGNLVAFAWLGGIARRRAPRADL